MNRMLLFFVLLLTLAPCALGAPDAASVDAVLTNLPWRNIGPAIMGGRIDDFAVAENNPSTYFVATAAGGLFRTINNGTTWDSVFDDQPVISIGDVTLAPSDPSVVWVGTGEANNRQSSSWGNGVYKSTDAGKTWKPMGLDETMHIGRIVIDPRNPDVVYVAAVGRLWGASKERGLYKTTDGGKTWTNSLFVDADTGCTDVAMDPQDPETLYAAMYQRRRTAFGFNGGGPGSGLYKTTDGGAHWTRLTQGLPTGEMGRIGLDIYRKNPKIVYTCIESASSGVYRSEDGGETWTRMSGIDPRPMYFSQLRVDPNDDQRLWLAGVSLTTSTDGGKTFRTEFSGRLHADVHAIWIDPANSNHLLVGCDGGIQDSYDRGQTWDYINTLPIGQLYTVACDMRKPYWVYGGLQDNGSWAGPSATLTVRGPSNDEWLNVGGGDGFYCQVDPTDYDVLYTESQQGGLRRYNQVTGESKSIRPRPPAGEPAYRFDWNTPVLISPHNPRKLLMGGNRLFISTDRGDTWRRTDDLSGKPDRDKMPIMGAVPSRRTLSLNDGQVSFGQIVTITESPKREGVIYVGTDDGNLQVSRDDGQTWKNVSDQIPGVPKGTYVSRVSASAYSEGRAYATFDGHRSNDFKPYVFVTEDYGDTWTSISSNLPEGGTALVVREHPRNSNLLFAGTERGLWISFDRGGHWTRPGAPLPPVPIDDIQVHPRDNDLILATHGRGVWILDDITPLEQLAERALPYDFALFDPRTAVGYRLYSHKGNTGNRIFVASNPPAGAIIQYYLKTKPSSDTPVRITILEKDGKTVVRELRPFVNNAGLNRITWDLHYASPIAVPIAVSVDSGRIPGGMADGQAANTGGTGRGTRRRQAGATGGGAGGGGQGPGGGGGFGGGFGGFGLRGPRALPGTYLVRLTVGKEEQTRLLRVEDDPRIKLTDAQRKTLFQMQMRLSNLYKSYNEARQSLQETRTQVTTLEGSAGWKSAPKPVQDAVASLTNHVTALQGRLAPIRRPTPAAGPAASESDSSESPETPASPPTTVDPLAQRLALLISTGDSFTEAPTPALRQRCEALVQEMRQVITEINTLNQKTIPDINVPLRANKLEPLPVSARIEPPR